MSLPRLVKWLLWRAAFALAFMALGAVVTLKILRSEQLRIMWNTPLYLFDDSNVESAGVPATYGGYGDGRGVAGAGLCDASVGGKTGC